MTSGTIDLPKVGHVLRYVYLFANEQKAGRDEGVKERFVVVIAIDGKRYSVAAITTKGEGRANALPLPAPVATAGGVAPNSSVVTDEINIFTWPGFDIRPLMKGKGFVAGRFPPAFTNSLQSAILSAPHERIDRD